MNKYSNIKTKWVYSILIVIIVVVYFPILFSQNPVNFDANLFDVLMEISSFQEYLRYFIEGKIHDVQPLRDLSMMIDILIMKHVKIDLRIVQNILIWTISIISLYHFLLLLKFRKKNALLLTVLIAVFPVHTQTVAWASARKHLLSLMFTLLMCNSYWKYRKRGWGSLITNFLYLCACFSQPINVLIPFVFVIVEKYFFHSSWKNSVKRIFPYFFTTIVTLGLNFWWYSFVYAESVGTEKFLGSYSTLLFSFGRVFYQLGFPFDLSFMYAVASHNNIVGLVFAILWGVTIYKNMNTRIIVLLFLVICPLLVMYIRPTAVFFLDQYVLLASIGFYGTLMDLYERNVHNAKWDYLIGVILVVFGCFSNQELSKWKNLEDHYRISFEREPFCRSAMDYYLATSDKIIKNQLKTFLQEQQCFIRDDGSTYTEEHVVRFIYSTMLNSKISYEKKVELLNGFIAKYKGVFNIPKAVLVANAVAEKTIDEEASVILKEILTLKTKRSFEDQSVVQALQGYCRRKNASFCKMKGYNR